MAFCDVLYNQCISNTWKFSIYIFPTGRIRVCEKTGLASGLARRGSTIDFHSLWHTVELVMSTRLCLSLWLIWFLCFRFDALTELGAFMRTEFLCISVLRVASGPRVKVASCKSALNPPVVYSTDRSKAVVPVLVLLFVALWFILRGDLFFALPCVILFLCFSVLLALRLPCLGKRELILVLFARLFDLCLFGFICFLFLLVSGKGCGLWLWHSSRKLTYIIMTPLNPTFI